MRRTKIIATIGPASLEPRVLSRMIRAGMDVARLNFSHGTYRDHTRAIRRIRPGSVYTVALPELVALRIRVEDLPKHWPQGSDRQTPGRCHVPFRREDDERGCKRGMAG